MPAAKWKCSDPACQGHGREKLGDSLACAKSRPPEKRYVTDCEKAFKGAHYIAREQGKCFCGPRYVGK